MLAKQEKVRNQFMEEIKNFKLFNKPKDQS